MPDYDLVIVGGGAAGSEAAFSVADRGRHRILLVESSHFGGTCTNHGCVPTKALVKAARVAHAIRTADRYGIRASEPVIDWPAVIGRADEVRDHMLRLGAEPFREAGVEVRYPARAVLAGERLLDIDGQLVEAGAVLLTASLMPALPPVPGLREAGYLDNEAALELKELPGRLVVLGCGPIGTEFAQLFSRLGVRVVIVEALDRMLPPEEPESGRALGDVFSEEGIELRLNARVEAVERTGSGRRLRAGPGPRRRQGHRGGAGADCYRGRGKRSSPRSPDAQRY